MAVRGGILLALTLGACATVESVAEPVETLSSTASLPAQALAPGECGLFGYSTDAPPNFVLFASSGGRALYQSPEGRRTLTADGEFPALSYDAGVVTLELGEAEALIDGQRYNRARVLELLDGGQARYRPLVVLESCG